MEAKNKEKNEDPAVDSPTSVLEDEVCSVVILRNRVIIFCDTKLY